jgi:2-dehydropantoate 2-reductase
MISKKVLVYGAGPLGSIFAAKLHDGGQDVSILARGNRLAELESSGIVLKNFHTKNVTTTHVNVITTLEPDDLYDLIMVIMRKNNAMDILDILKKNKTPHILFLMNNFEGPGVFIRALGKERVLFAFPSSAGYREGHMIHMLTGTAQRPFRIPFGEVDGTITPRTREIAALINTMPGYKADIRKDMDAWLKYHVALLFTALAPALFIVKLDKHRLARTRDLLVLIVRGIKEAFRIIKSLGCPVSPSGLRIFTLLPEPILVAGLRKRITSEVIDIVLLGHAKAIGDEVHYLLKEFMEAKKASSIPTPALDQLLLPYVEGKIEEIADGSAALPMRWGGLIFLGISSALFLAGIILLIRGLFFF